MQLLEHSGLAGLIALALPILALITVMALAVRQISKRRRDGASQHLTGRYGAPVKKVPTPMTSSAVKKAAAPAPPVVPDVMSADEIAQRIAKAEQRSAEAELAPLYLALARAHIANGSPDAAAELLRKSIRLAAKLGQKQTHAGARLELGDLVREQGDHTTACEHWQIARGLYYDLKYEGELAAAEKRMRHNGCPTDWVLNDF